MSISQGNILSFAKQLFLALIVYCFLILCLGYEFGSGDQTEFIPLLRDNILNGYFKKDFFVQNYLLSGHDVRHGVIATCDIGNRFLELNWWLFILHFLSGMVMILGGMAVLGHFTKNKALLVAALCIIWGILYGINLGSKWCPTLHIRISIKGLLSVVLLDVNKPDFRIMNMITYPRKTELG